MALLAAAAGGAVWLDRRGDDDAESTRSRGATQQTIDAIRGFCKNPTAIRNADAVARFTPGQGTVAFAPVPQPDSSIDPPTEMVFQASPTIGKPTLRLEESWALVSLALCIEETATTPTKVTCRYELTTQGSVGEKDKAKLRTTSYRIRLMELTTGKVLAKGTIDTPIDQCPELAYLDRDGVSMPLTEDLVLAWLGEHLVNGQPR